MKENIKDIIIKIIVIIITSALLAVNIKTFVNAGGLYPGGVTGITLLVQRYVEMMFGIEIPYTLINVILNLFPVYIGFRFIGKKFTIYSCLVIVLSAVMTDLLPSYTITSDLLLISVFGGLMNGAVISFCLGAGITTGGTDFIAIYFSEKKGQDSFPIILGINVVIIGLAGYLFGWDKALYSIIFQYVTTQVLHMLYRQYQQKTFFVVTDHPEEVCSLIYDNTGHGATVIEGVGSFEHQRRAIVYSVVSSAQAKQLLTKIKKIDPDVFVNILKTEQVSGRFYLKPYD